MPATAQVPADPRYRVIVNFKARETEAEALKAAASLQGLTVSALIRAALAGHGVDQFATPAQ
jgi:hypothetical protein